MVPMKTTKTPTPPTQTTPRMLFVDACKQLAAGKVVRSIDTFLFISTSGELWCSQGKVWAWAALGQASISLVALAVFELNLEAEMGVDAPGWYLAYGVDRDDVLATKKG